MKYSFFVLTYLNELYQAFLFLKDHLHTTLSKFLKSIVVHIKDEFCLLKLYVQLPLHANVVFHSYFSNVV